MDVEGEVIDIPSLTRHHSASPARHRSVSPALSDSKDSWVTVEGEELEELICQAQEEEAIVQTADICVQGAAQELKSEETGQCFILEGDAPSE